MAYVECVSANGGRLPADETQLKNFIRQKSVHSSAAGAASDVDDLFVSVRDGLPLVIKYGQKSGTTAALAPDTIIAHEKTGIGGKRLVALPSGGVAELDDAAFATATSAPVASSAANSN